MQYLLTGEELKNLTPKENVERRDEALLWAREQILSAHGISCIHDTNAKGERYGGYCDFCPISPHGAKELQHKPISYELSKLICNKNRNYSK